MKYVLDTNAVSSLMRGDVPMLERLKRVTPADVGLPQPVLAEIAYGIARLPSSKRRKSLEEGFELVASTFERVQWTDDVSRAFGEIKARLERKGTRIEDFDAAIAAHAVAVGAVLVTANVRDMARVPGLSVEDWGE